MQTIFQLIGLLGLFLALIGSIYLAKRVLKKEITLQQFLKRNYKSVTGRQRKKLGGTLPSVQIDRRCQRVLAPPAITGG